MSVEGVVVVPGMVGAAITVGALLLTYMYCHKRQTDLWRSCLLVTVVFLSIYPMIRASYFMIPFAFLTVWAVDDKTHPAAHTLACMCRVMISQAMESLVNSGQLPSEYAWIGLLSLIIGLAVLADATRLAMKKRCFLDRPMGRADPIIGSDSSSSAVRNKATHKMD